MVLATGGAVQLAILQDTVNAGGAEGVSAGKGAGPVSSTIVGLEANLTVYDYASGGL